MSTNGERYKTGSGYVTEHSRRLFIEEHPSIEAPTSLVAGKDGEPLYFWQLHSILGSQRIEAIIRRFYTLVWEGEDWFKQAFVATNDLEGHIWTQSAFWIDAMGGGKAYHGGHFRLSFHHSRIEEAMTRKGAIRWLELMRQALEESDLTDDARVRPCISAFLELHMNKYGEQFEYETQGLDYEIGSSTAPQAAPNGAQQEGTAEEPSAAEEAPAAEAEQ